MRVSTVFVMGSRCFQPIPTSSSCNADRVLEHEGVAVLIVRQAIDQGHSVTAFVRSPERLKPFAGHVAIRKGDLLNSAQLDAAIAGHDAVHGRRRAGETS